MTLVQKEIKKITMRPNGTEKQIRPVAQPITTAWIYHNSDLWLISLSSDWTNWITMADKNLWATSTDISIADSYWNYFQRWNNYPFPKWAQQMTSSYRVNAGNYWPWNYYNVWTFIIQTYWDSSNNNNLWWWTTDTYIARQWPCNNWHHIPSTNDCTSLWNILTSLWVTSNYESLLMIPKAWFDSRTNWNYTADSNYYYLWASDFGNSNSKWNCIGWWYNLNDLHWQYKGMGFPIRPFANTPVQPDSSRIKLN